MRSLRKGEALVKAAGRALGRTLEVRQLDVSDEASIRACVDSLPERRVDVLSQFLSFLASAVLCSSRRPDASLCPPQSATLGWA